MKVAELTGAPLALWVARAFGNFDAFLWTNHGGKEVVYLRPTDAAPYMPHEDGTDGLPLINNWITTLDRTDGQGTHPTTRDEPWYASTPRSFGIGATPLIAACRAVVFATYGSEVPE